MDDRTEALLQDAAFEEPSVDCEALAALLARDEAAQLRLAQFEALAETLRSEGPVGPTASLRQSVMEAVSARSRHDLPGDGRGAPMYKKWIVGIAATVAAALGIYVAAGGNIPPRGAEGTIGAAKRYQGQQISTADVQLGDQALQTFLQSATFDKLRRDPALRKSFVKVVSSPAFAKVANDANFARLASSDAFLALATDAELMRLAVDSSFVMLASDAELKRLVNDAAFQQLMIDSNFRMLMQDANFMMFLQDANMKALLSDANMKHLTNDAALAQLANDAELAGATAGRKAGGGQVDY